MSKKVLIVSSVASMIEQFNIPNINLLISMGFKVHVACNFIEGNNISDSKIEKLKCQLTSLGVKYYQIDFSRNAFHLKKNFVAYTQLKKIVESHNFSFIHCHSPVGGVCSRIVGVELNTKVIYTAHGFHFYKGAPIINWILYYPIEKILSKFTNLIITINKEDYAFSRKHFGNEKTEFLKGVGVSLERFKVSINDKFDTKRNLGLDEDDFVIVSVGELNKNKNHKIIIKALANFKNLKIHYLICGKGALELKLKELAKKLGIKNQVHFLGYRDDISDILKISDIFAFPSFREGLSVSLMEAISAGLPVISSKIRGNIDLVDNQFNGFLIDNNSANLYAKCISILYLDTELRNSMSFNGLKKIQEYDLEAIMLKTKEIYSRYLND